MKVKLRSIIDNLDNIKELQDVELPTKVSYRIKRLLDKLQPALDTYNKERIALIHKFGEEDPKTKEWKVKEEKLQEFYSELQKLLDVEEEVEFNKVKEEELENIKIKTRLLVDFIFE